MITCKKCSTQLDEGSRFCYNCGTEVTETRYCRQCNTQINDDESYCKNCGTPVSVTEGQVLAKEVKPETEGNANVPPVTPVPGPVGYTPQPVPFQGPVPGPMPVPNANPAYPYGNTSVKKKGIKLPFILAGAGALVIVILLALLLVPKAISGLSKTPEGVVYLKDSEINYSPLTKIKPKEITEDLNAGISQYLSISFSEDGKRMFYPDETSSYEVGKTIYYCDVNSKNPKGKKIDSNITSYAINKKGTKVYYIKGSDNDFYVSNLKDKDKIDDDVTEFYLDNSGNNLIYTTSDGTIYRKKGSKDKEKIASNAVLKAVVDDLEKIFFLKDGKLYVKDGNKDDEKIDSDVFDVIKVFATGEAYYLKSKDAQLHLSDFVNDDLADSDAAMVDPIEPAMPDYYSYQPSRSYPTEPSYWDYTDSWGYIDWDSYYDAYDEYSEELNEYNQEWEDAYNAAVDKYNQEYDRYLEAYEEYYDKAYRDSWRETFANETVSVTEYSLYYYGDGTSTLVTDSYHSYIDYGSSEPVLLYYNNYKGEFNKINMSEITDYYDVYNLATEATSFTTDVYVAVNVKTSKLNHTEGASFNINGDENKIYYLDHMDSKTGEGDLYSVVIKGTSLEAPQLYDKQVSIFYVTGEKDDVIYYKNVEDSEGDLYISKKMIDSDVSIYSAYKIIGTDKFIYETDYDNDDYTYTLNLYDGKNTVKIANDVYSNTAYGEKYIAYLTDYDRDEHTGSLYLYNGSKKRKLIDEDVSAILYVYSNYYYGGSSYYN